MEETLEDIAENFEVNAYSANNPMRIFDNVVKNEQEISAQKRYCQFFHCTHGE